MKDEKLEEFIIRKEESPEWEEIEEVNRQLLFELNHENVNAGKLGSNKEQKEASLFNSILNRSNLGDNSEIQASMQLYIYTEFYD